jgi:type IV secretion system protein VirB4
VTVWHEDPRVAADRLRLIEKVIQGRDFTTITEGVNAVERGSAAFPVTSTPTSASRRSRPSTWPT